jgi:hypothetical protein
MRPRLRYFEVGAMKEELDGLFARATDRPIHDVPHGSVAHRSI